MGVLYCKMVKIIKGMLLFIYAQLCAAVITGSPLDSYILKTESLPADLNFMPSLSNGHLGYTVFGDAIFMNGIYNGAGGNSQRARIPNWINITAQICDKFGCLTDDSEFYSGSTYEMNLRDGYFHYRKNYKNLGLALDQRTYPHRFYNRAVVYEVLAMRHPNQRDGRANGPLHLKLIQEAGNQSSAFDFEVVQNGSSKDGDYRILRGRTKVLEFEPIQSQPHEIYVFSSESLENTRLIDWPTWIPELYYRVIITMDRQESVARKELDDILKLDAFHLLARHYETWHNFWDRDFSIEFLGDLELSRIVNAGIFYLASSLPSLASNQPNELYFGLSPTGLARGNLAADYQGHNFWDTEIWMLPVATQLHYDYGKHLFDYRLQHLAGARHNAQSTGYKGVRFPWESAYTGTEVTNPCCPEVAQQEIHISPDIAFALQKFFGQIHDFEWLCQTAWPIVLEVAEFLVSRASCEETQSICHLLHVMGPDEDHPNVDDNTYTNVVSKIALEFAEWTGGKCGNESTAKLYESWRKLSQQLLVLKDLDLDYHPQHQGYLLNATVKQADTILLGFPLLYDSSSTHLNDLKYYAGVTRESGPAMTWSMFAANYLATSEPQQAQAYFERGYQSYVRPEFKVWSETPIGYEGSANFLTGIGGFLQALIFGYGGIDFRRNNDTSQLIKRSSSVPKNVERVSIKYIKFAQSKCSLEFTNISSTLDCKGPEIQSFLLMRGEERILLNSSFIINFAVGDPVSYINVL